MTDNLQDFVSTFQNLFPGVQVPPMPKEPGELGLSAEMAIRQSNPALWQRLFGGLGAPLPADIQQQLLTGQVYPEDAAALRAAHMDAYAAEADQHRQRIIDRAREATRAREKAIYEQQVQRSMNTDRWVCLLVWLLHPLVSVQQLKPEPLGVSLNDRDSNQRRSG